LGDEEIKEQVMIRLLAVIERDLKKFRRNPVVLAMSIMLPIIYLVILGNSFQGKLQGLPLMIVNQDTGPYSRRLLDNLKAVADGPKTFTILSAMDENTALKGVRKGKYKAVLIIPPDYSRKIVVKGRPEIGLFLDNADGISSAAIQNAVFGALQSTQAEYVPIRERTEAIHLRSENLYPQVDYSQSLVPGVVIMAIFLGALTTGAFNLVMDRFLGVDESYMLTPLTKFDIVVGLIASGLSVTLLISIIILTLSTLITGISISTTLLNFFPLLLILLLTTTSMLSLMFVMLGRLRHPRIVGIISGFMNVILFFPSGAVYPIASFPSWLKIFAKINPEAYAVDALKSVLFKGAGLGDIWSDLLYLIAFTVIMMTVAIFTFKRTL
jgi:ABC-2 type transport system permease protein